MANLKCFLFQIYLIVLFLIIIKPNLGYGTKKYTKEDLLKLREEVREMFNHAYSGYLKYAYPYDELRPLTCDGVDTWGSYSLTLIDALDTLAVMGNYSEFRRVVDIVVAKANFDANINVSVFETNIRIVGGLLSAHLLSQRAGVELEPGWPCNGPLLRLAEDVAKRLIAAFDTSTGMPYGTVNLRHGVPPGETSITCTAGVGTFILEFGSLSRLTGDPIYEEVALNALYSLYYHRSSIGLYGNHIDVQTGRWTAQDSGIGAGVDSYLEYLVKGALLVHRPELMAIFNEGRIAIDKHLKRNDWYLWVSMHKGQVTLPVFQSLEAYWPGVLSLIGDISGGMKSMHNYHQVWKQYGFTPEFYNIAQGQVGTNRESYPLRPELIESTMYLYRATGDPFLLDVGTDILRSIQHSARTKCGYATIKDCRDHSLENRMESFFLAETTKYLYLLFDTDNFIHNNGRQGAVHVLPSGRECILDAGGYIFNTEAHPLDPGALLCCSENFDEPKRYNRKAARGEKFTSFAKPDQTKSSQQSEEPNSVLPMSGNIQEQDNPDLPSSLTEEELLVYIRGKNEHKQQATGAIDIIRIPPPSEGDDQFVAEQNRLTLNMLEVVGELIDNNLKNQISKASWCHDLLKELMEVIDHTEKVSNQGSNTEYSTSSRKEQAPSKDTHSNKEDNTNDEEDSKSSVRKIVGETAHENDSLSDTNNQEIKSPKQSNKSPKPSYRDSSTPAPEALENKNKDKSFFELVIVEQFETIKSTVLTETEILDMQVSTCLKNLEITRNLVDVVNDKEIQSQFTTRRLEVTLLASTVKDSADLTKTLLSSDEYEKTITLESFKKLVEVVVESKIVKDFLDKYVNYLLFLKEIIAVGKSSYNTNQSFVGNDVHVESLVSVEQNNSDEENSSVNEGVENSFQENNWKADDITYQVDDRERVVPVTKVDAGPLFTDRPSLKAESVVSLLPKSLVSSESPFNPQMLLERIRANPKYPRNLTWTTQYNLLTCLPQPYFTRIMLSGEFYND